MRGIPVPENDWTALNLKLLELSQQLTGIDRKLSEVVRRIEAPVEEATIEESAEGASAETAQETETEVSGEEEYDGPGNVFFDASKCSFDGEHPELYWQKLDDKDVRYEIRLDANFGSRTNLIEVTASDSYTVKKWKPSDGRGPVTFYIKAKDKEDRYSRAYDTITLSNAAPSMSGFYPVVTMIKNDRTALVDWSQWSGLTATDLDGFKVYRSTETTCTISDENFVDKAPKTKTKMKVTNLQKGVTYDFRVVPCDVFGDGTASS